MSIQLADYDYVVVNTSSGKDSQTTLRYIMGQAEYEGYPKEKIVCAHADLGAMEWPGTVDLAKQQADHYGLRFWKMARPQGDLLSHILIRSKWPDNKNRYCTSDHKRGQIAKLFTELTDGRNDPSGRGRSILMNGLHSTPNHLPARILNVMGMRAEESPARAKLVPFIRDDRASNGKRHVDRWLPIHSLTLADVWKDINASGVPYHKAYDLGMPRLSCVFCIFSPPAALMIAGRHNPELLARYVKAERTMGHTFRKDFPIENVQAAIAAGEDWGKATDWVM